MRHAGKENNLENVALIYSRKIRLVKYRTSQRKHTMPMHTKTRKTRCLTHGCDRVAVCRGVCHKCYMRLRYAVTAHKVSWSVMERAGVVKPLRDIKTEYDAT